MSYSFTTNGCTVTATKIITVTNPPNVIAGASQTICATSLPLQLTGFSPAGGIWSGQGVTTSGIFTPDLNLIGSQTLTYTVSQNGCSVSASKIITVTAPPVVEAGPAQTLCASAPAIQLTGFSPAGGTWSGPGVTATGLFTPAINLIGTQTLFYSLSQNGCTVSASKIIDVTPEPIVSAGASQSVCTSTEAFQLTGNPTGGIWSGVGVSASGLFTPGSVSSGNHTLNYTVSSNGCSVSSPVNVIVKPTLQFSLGPDITVCEGEEVMLQAESTTGSLLWSDGSTNSKLKVSSSGEYWVQLLQDGCIAYDTIRVFFKPCPPPFIPNIITINNDGYNDTFQPQYLPEGTWQIQIYNRWGNRIYESKDYRNNWPDSNTTKGTYYYLLENLSTKQQLKGWVEVIE